VANVCIPTSSGKKENEHLVHPSRGRSKFALMTRSALSHLGDQGDVRMVDVSSKKVTQRSATAEALVFLPPPVLALFENGDLQGPKGPVFQIARIAGIQAAKRTGELIPLCHPIGLDSIELTFSIKKNEVYILASARVEAKTGVEMEALTAASVAALTIYDMCKAVSHEIEIRAIRLLEKTGGKNDFKRN